MRERLKNKSIQDGAALLLAGLALGAYCLIRQADPALRRDLLLSPWLFPMLLAAFTVLLGLALLAEGRRELRDVAAAAASPAPHDRGRLAAVLLSGLVYAALLPLLRFVPATALYLAAAMLLLGERRPRLIAALALLIPPALYALFALALNVRLP